MCVIRTSFFYPFVLLYANNILAINQTKANRTSGGSLLLIYIKVVALLQFEAELN